MNRKVKHFFIVSSLLGVLDYITTALAAAAVGLEYESNRLVASLIGQSNSPALLLASFSMGLGCVLLYEGFGRLRAGSGHTMALAFVGAQLTVVVSNMASFAFGMSYINHQWILYPVLALLTYSGVFYASDRRNLPTTIGCVFLSVLSAFFLYFFIGLRFQAYYMAPLLGVMLFKAVVEVSKRG
ncbi:MAG: hypothetical protein V1921_03485 [Candidatus Altiarchaeota archaeon]